MPLFYRNHLLIQQHTETLPYTSTINGRTTLLVRTINDRNFQGTKIEDNFRTAAAEAGFEDSEYINLTFRSAVGFFLDLQKLDNKNFRLASYKRIDIGDNEDEDNWCYEATVCLNKTAVKQFLKKVEEYLNINTEKGNPRNNPLIANIEEIRAATMESFWQEIQNPFPNTQESIWWEIWLNKDDEDGNPPVELIVDILINDDIEINNKILSFPEHWVFLIKATTNDLGQSLLYTNRLAEIRSPKNTADFFTYLDVQAQQPWVDDLIQRVNHEFGSNISVCLLDTGVNIANPLLQNLIPVVNLTAVDPTWTTADTHIHGHGTPMAGLILYGDLTELLASNEQVTITHQLESVKLIERNQNHKPELYGAVTQEAIARAEIINPQNKRLVCLAVTATSDLFAGRPSSWSAAIDQIMFGSVEEPNEKLLCFISSGNLPHDDRINYPLSNDDCSIEDPAQSFNAISVGSYTLKDSVDLVHYPGSVALAHQGAMSPCNTTSVKWNNEWCRKPDIVMEGGNDAILNDAFSYQDSLQLLSTSKGGVGRSWLHSFGDTSASTALASKFAAELYHSYPALWPETIRALIIHSSEWTHRMLTGRTITQLNENERKKLVSQVGYGVPNLQRAKYSANNSLSLIVERILKPYKIENGTVKTEEFHLFDLPWPTQVLEELFDTSVQLTITLSYFIEPNPGSKRYELAASYRSHGLRFKVIDRNESEATFKSRVSKAMRDVPYNAEGSEHWILSNRVRDKGSIHKDLWVGTASELAARNKIAVYPVGGWWKTRKKMERYNYSVRYSLVVTIDAPQEDIDLYTPVLNQLQLEV